MNLRRKRYTENDLKRIVIENNWSGQGSEKNPYIIESSFESYLQSTTYINSRYFHIHFKNCNFRNNTIFFERCQNIILENCQFSKRVLIHDSIEITLISCSFSDKLTLMKCNNIKIEYSNILSLELDLSYNNYIKNCRIAKLYNYLSRGNTLKSNDIPSIYLKSFTKGSKENRSKWHIIMYLSIYFSVMMFTYLMLLLAGDPVIEFFPLTMIIVAIPLTFLIIIVYVAQHPKFIESKKYPPNRIE